MSIAFIADGFHPPWVEGGINVLKRWLTLLSTDKRLTSQIITFVDEIRLRESLLFKRGLSVSVLDKHLRGFWKQAFLIRRFCFAYPDPLHQAVYRTLSGLRMYISMKELVKQYKHLLNNSDYIHVHNVSWLISVKFLKDYVKEGIFFSFLGSDDSRLKLSLRVLNRYVAGVATTSFRVSRLLKNESKIFLIPPPPIKSLSFRNFNNFKCNGKHERERFVEMVKDITRSKDLIVYIGQVNHIRFPLNLLVKIAKALPRLNAFLLIITPPLPNNIVYVRKMEKLIKQRGLKHILIHTSILTSKDLDQVLSSSQLFIFPSIKVGKVIDPPLSVVDALNKHVFVVASDIGSLPELIKLSKLGKIVELKPDFEERFVDVIETTLKYHDLPKKVDKSFKRFFSHDFIIRRFYEMYGLK